MTENPWQFSAAEREAVYRAIRERRDMRHFSGEPLDSEILKRLLQAAHQAPSVGLMQPWRFIRITDSQLRASIRGLVEQERQATADVMNEREAEFLRLKVEGMDRCAEVLVVALMDQREKHIFGRRTLPEMDLASVSCAIQNLWLAARAEGVGVGLGLAVRSRGAGRPAADARGQQGDRRALHRPCGQVLRTPDAGTGRLGRSTAAGGPAGGESLAGLGVGAVCPWQHEFGAFLCCTHDGLDSCRLPINTLLHVC